MTEDGVERRTSMTVIGESALIKAAAGGSFLLEERLPEEIFTPEDFTEEQRQMGSTAASFVRNEVLPVAAAIEAKDFETTRKLLRVAGQLGLMAVDVPEEFGGLALDKTSSAIIAENVSQLGSFSVAFSAHTGIGTLPIVWYGRPEQKNRYLPKLASGEMISAYALSEASSGSDAMNIRTRATLSADGKHYLLNGEKMWISNAGFADLFTVFAKVDGEKFTAFLIERGTKGLTVGNEEHKLGIRGSSTCPLILSDCAVPVENVLGEVGKGHQIAFNILNVGRLKLGVACVGSAKQSLAHAVRYAKDRKAFGKSISEFGLIQQKIAECAAGIYVAESLSYRTVGMIDAALLQLPENARDNSKEIQKRIEEYAVECSILKVWGSEMLDRVVDHTVQIFGGYGYVEEYPAERAYRDSRINRIFEGTNEINRQIITGWLLKRATAGALPLMPAIKQVMEEITAPPSLAAADSGGPLGQAVLQLGRLRKVALFVAGAASQRYMTTLAEQQEIVADLADIIMQVFALESAILRAQKLTQRKSGPDGTFAELITQYYTSECITMVDRAARRVLNATAQGDVLRTQLAILRRLVKQSETDTIALGREIARRVYDSKQ
jgi:alkylation response protein AidB-like acyl-CoA dehydrogenase